MQLNFLEVTSHITTSVLKKKRLGFWEEIISGVTQRSKSAPLLFNIFLNDIFFVLKDVSFANSTDYSDMYSYNKTLYLAI